MIRLLCAVLLLLVALPSHGNTVSEGALAWSNGDGEGALRAWAALDERGWASGVVHHNLGNAWYEQGDTARAMAHWRMARQLRPRDPRPLRNLALARAELKEVPEPVGPPVPWMVLTTVTEVGLLGAGLLALASGLALRRRRRGGSGALVLSVALAGLLLGGLAVRAEHTLAQHPVAVLIEEGAVREEPSAMAPPRFRLPPGAEVAVEARRGAFLLVRTADGRRGWVPGAAALVVEPSGPRPG